jgi:CheY-like chemotaxis protein
MPEHRTVPPRALLVVEDSDDDAALIRRAFQKGGFTNPFLVVARPEEAIRYLQGDGEYVDRARFPFPHLVLLDHRMPGDGRVVIEWVRKRPDLAAVRIVVFSGSENPQHEREAYELGANDYRRKPHSFEEFTRAVKRIVELWLIEPAGSGQ